MIRENFFIHGNGINSLLAPSEMKSVDMPGHNVTNWDPAKYSMSELVSFYENIVPMNSIVWGHSLGGHIAINLALRRADIRVICFGMVPLNSLSEIGTLMTPYAELGAFQNPDRSEEDIKGFLKYSSLGNDDLLEKLYMCSKNQDPIFNATLFTSGILDYDWNEQDKAKELADRFLLILSENEKLYNFKMAEFLDINILYNHYHGHCPWLLDSKWIKNISKSLKKLN